jgi:exonuclease SbcC
LFIIDKYEKQVSLKQQYHQHSKKIQNLKNEIDTLNQQLESIDKRNIDLNDQSHFLNFVSFLNVDDIVVLGKLAFHTYLLNFVVHLIVFVIDIFVQSTEQQSLKDKYEKQVSLKQQYHQHSKKIQNLKNDIETLNQLHTYLLNFVVHLIVFVIDIFVQSTHQ